MILVLIRIVFALLAGGWVYFDSQKRLASRSHMLLWTASTTLAALTVTPLAFGLIAFYIWYSRNPHIIARKEADFINVDAVQVDETLPMNFCPKCGKETRDEYNLCPYCGTSLKNNISDKKN